MHHPLSIIVASFSMFGSCLCIHAQLTNINNPFLRSDSTAKTVLFSPITSIGYIEKEELVQHSDSISLQTATVLKNLLFKQKVRLKYDFILPPLDTATTNTIQYELDNIVNGEPYNDLKKKWLLPPYIDSILMESGYTYGMIFYQNGFLRKKSNFRGQVWKSIAVGVLSMGSYINTPQKSQANLYSFWLDGKRKTIQCIGKEDGDGKGPTDTKTVEEQVNNIIASKNNTHL